MELESRLYYIIKEELESSGYYETAENTSYIRAVEEYLEQYCPNDYTVKDWLRDTKWNYPEDLK